MLIKHILKFQTDVLLQNHIVHFSLFQTSVLDRLLTFFYHYVTTICKILNWEKSATKIWQHQGQSRLYHLNSHIFNHENKDLIWQLLCSIV